MKKDLVFLTSAVALTLTFVFTIVSNAAEQTTENRIKQSYTTTRTERGWLPSVGLTYGYMEQNGTDGLDGGGMGISAVGTMYYPNSDWLADAGLGIQKFYLQDNLSPTVGVLSGSTRYVWQDRLSAGPSLDVFLNNGESFGSNNNQAAFVGLVGVKEFLMKDDQMLKIGVKYNTGLFTSGQASNFLGMTAEWAVGSRSTTVR